MLIRFYNLGAIEQTEMDLRPLTLIIGPNNSHKTYLAYSVYALWQSLRFSSDRKMSFRSEDQGGWSVSLTDWAEYVAEEMTKKEFRPIKLEKFFQDSSGKTFSNAKFDFIPSAYEIKNNLKNYINKNEYYGFIDGRLISSFFYVKEDRVYIKQHQNGSQLTPPEISQGQLTSALNLRIHNGLFPRPLSLPAERSGFVLTYKLLSTRRYKLLKELQRDISSSPQSAQETLALLEEQGYQAYPVPIEAFLDFLVDIETEGDPSRSPKNNPFDALANQIEAQIQGHHQVNFHALPAGGKTLKLRVREGLDIDLYNASSSIKQLTPLILYLRYRARPNSFLIIDEPELNLHPESQAKLLEAIAIMVNLGVRVLITTHSPYFMNHVNNLISGDTDKPEILQSQAHSLYLKNARAFLSEDQVSAYEMRDFKLCPLKDEDYGIRWDTLSDVSSELQQRYFEIFEKSQASGDLANQLKSELRRISIHGDFTFESIHDTKD